MLARVQAIRSGVGITLLWAFGIGLAGTALGWIAQDLFGPNQAAVTALAIIAGLMLLWASLGLQGWNIQTDVGDTLPERINQWIYRCLSLGGAFVAVISASWGTPCRSVAHR